MSIGANWTCPAVGYVHLPLSRLDEYLFITKLNAGIETRKQPAFRCCLLDEKSTTVHGPSYPNPPIKHSTEKNNCEARCEYCFTNMHARPAEYSRLELGVNALSEISIHPCLSVCVSSIQLQSGLRKCV